MTERPDYAREIKAELTDPRKVCEALRIDLKHAKRQAGGGLLVLCPKHNERTPSCSVSLGESKTLRVHCFGCQWGGDVFHLVSEVEQIPLSSFVELMQRTAELGGLFRIADELRTGEIPADRPKPKPLAPPDPPLPHMPIAEVRAVWERATSARDDRATSAYLVRRVLDPEIVTARSLARVLAAPVPPWAIYGRRSWLETGHRLIFRVFDAWGNAKGIRGSCVEKNDTPKRLPAKGYRAAELVLANRAAWAMLRGDAPPKILIAEGETDWLTLATVQPEEVPVLGIGSGSWSPNFAAAIPRNADVYIYTDPDPAGDRYAQNIIESLGEKCRTWRAA